MTTQHAPELAGLEWTFGDRLRKIRRARNLSQEEFAGALDVSAKSLAAWESDAWLPRAIVAIAKRIQISYGVPVSWTLGLDEGPTGGPGNEELPHLDSNQEPAD